MPFWAILVVLSHSSSFRCCFGPFWGPRGYPNGPRVVQHDIKSCNIPMWSVLGSFRAFQGNIWSVAPFIPVGPSENQWKNTKMQIVQNPLSARFWNFLGWMGSYWTKTWAWQIIRDIFFVWGFVKARCEVKLFIFSELQDQWNSPYLFSCPEQLNRWRTDSLTN